MAGVLFPVAAQAANGVCLGRKVTLAGTGAADPLVGGNLADVLAGLDGGDDISGGGGDDRLCGGRGNDFLSGGDGADLLRGNEGDDVLVGGAGADRYNGGPGRDICDFGPGDRSSGGCEASMEDDSDQDGLLNAVEIALRTNPFAADSDGDGRSDLEEATDGRELGIAQADLDDDGDLVPNGVDNCPSVPNAGQENQDAPAGDTEGDACDADDDGDGILDEADNCKTLPNLDQADLDKDGLGDACDGDVDGDMIDNAEDLCPTRMHGDRNYGGCPPLVPGDGDGDGFADGFDNCAAVSNPGQEDLDDDGIGDACQDQDGDGVNDPLDNCPAVANPGQLDDNKNGRGNACDIPTFQEFLNALFSDPGTAMLCFMIGVSFCMYFAGMLYFLLFGVEPECGVICGGGPMGRMGPAMKVVFT